MVIRLILRFLSNNEQLIHRLSESGPIRSAARFVVLLFNRGKSIAEEKQLSAESLKDIAKKFSDNVKHEIKQAQEELKRKK